MWSGVSRLIEAWITGQYSEMVFNGFKAKKSLTKSLYLISHHLYLRHNATKGIRMTLSIFL